MKSKFARKVHLASTQTELPHSHTPPAPAPCDWQICRRKCAYIAGTTAGTRRWGGVGVWQVLGRCPGWLCHASKRNQFPLENWLRPLPWAQVSSCCTNKYFAPDVWVTIAPSPAPPYLPQMSFCCCMQNFKYFDLQTVVRSSHNKWTLVKSNWNWFPYES